MADAHVDAHLDLRAVGLNSKISKKSDVFRIDAAVSGELTSESKIKRSPSNAYSQDEREVQRREEPLARVSITGSLICGRHTEPRHRVEMKWWS